MLFNSIGFLLLFLPLVWLVAALLQQHAARGAVIVWLGLASLAFYGVGNWTHLPLLLGSILFNWQFGGWVRRATTERRARFFTGLGVAINLILLGGFKYAGFAVQNVNLLLGMQWPVPAIALPIGISFYTFTQIAFLVDTCRERSTAYGLSEYTLFVSYFPHLVAGPILHHRDVIPQFRGAPLCRFDAPAVSQGLALFAFGLAKKVLVADRLAPFADATFAAAHAGTALSFWEAWFGLLAYSFQLYFDFSGYSEMALGLSLAMGVRIPVNFRSPYRATSIIDFWRRWHISLSDFLRQYVYVPLGGNRHGVALRYANLMATMLIGGLWHGAGWGFVVWGGLHGLFLVVNHAWRQRRSAARTTNPKLVASLASGALTFLAVTLAWAFFRASDLDAAFQLLAAAGGAHGVALPQSLGDRFGIPIAAGGMFPNELTQEKWMWVAVVLCGALLAFTSPSATSLSGTEAGAPGSTPQRNFVIAGILLGVALLSLSDNSPFLYFQF